MTADPSTWRPADTFGNRLTLIRREKGLTVEDAARLAGVAHPTWSTWEHGARPRDLADVVSRISTALGVDRVWLTWGGPLRTSDTSPTDSSTLRYLVDAA